MQNQTPFVREAGNGPVIVCLHANASTSGQWRPLMERLSPTHRVVTPDLYGAGQSPDWPSRSVITLNDEVDLIEPLITEHDAPLTLVGHSYGGAVALKAALRHRERVSALVLYEPTLFSVVDALNPCARTMACLAWGPLGSAIMSVASSVRPSSPSVRSWSSLDPPPALQATTAPTERRSEAR